MSEILRGPAYRIETERLVLRCYEPRDAAALKAAIDSSLDHLRPFIPWARDEPQTLDQKVTLLRGFRAKFDGGEDRIFGVFDAGERELLGGCGLHCRAGEGGRDLGYWIAAQHARRGYATEASRAVVRAAFEIDGLERVELHCEPENAASRALAAKLGFHHDGTLRAKLPSGSGPFRDCMVWSMLRAEYPSSPCATAAIRAFDAIGRAIEVEDRLGGGSSPARGRSAFR
jgi:RimJ/RimL family protein N-acetyltransferase